MNHHVIVRYGDKAYTTWPSMARTVVGVTIYCKVLDGVELSAQLKLSSCNRKRAS